MSKVLLKKAGVIILLGLLCTGCYTQLEITNKSTEKDNPIETAEPIYGYSYYDYFGNYNYLYNPYNRFNSGYFYSNYVYPFGYGYYGAFGIVGINYDPNVTNTRYNRQKVRSSGLYASGNREDRRSDRSSSSNNRSSTIDNRQIVSDDGERFLLRSSSLKNVRSRSTKLNSRYNDSDYGHLERVKSGAVQSRGRNFAHRNNTNNRIVAERRTNGKQLLRSRTSSIKRQANVRRTLDHRDNANRAGIITRRTFENKSNAEIASGASKSLIARNIENVKTAALTSRRAIQNSLASNYYKNTRFMSTVEYRSNTSRSSTYSKRTYRMSRDRSGYTRSRGRSNVTTRSTGRSSRSTTSRTRSSSNNNKSRSTGSNDRN